MSTTKELNKLYQGGELERWASKTITKRDKEIDSLEAQIEELKGFLNSSVNLHKEGLEDFIGLIDSTNYNDRVAESIRKYNEFTNQSEYKAKL